MLTFRFTLIHYNDHKVAANCLEIDKSNSYLYTGFENGYLGCINTLKGVLGTRVKGHEASINALGTNLMNKNLFSVGSDGNIAIWQ
jgi:hypothetical protein